jgi:outer membrane protein OmpA-like peptidoglycan-associated protein
MRLERKTSPSIAVWTLLVTLMLSVAAFGQNSDAQKAATQSQLANAEAALASAQAAGAPTLAAELYQEAARRLQIARSDWTSTKKELAHIAGLRAIEAGYAAAAAEAQALLVSSNNEFRNLRGEIGTMGGTSANFDLYDPPTNINRGITSLDRVIVAENAVNVAKSVGGQVVAPEDMKRAEGILETARMLAKRNAQNESSNHLAFIAEMMARRAEFIARRNLVTPRLPELRGERTRLAQVVADNRAREEQARRLEAERQAEELRRQLQAESATRQVEQAELDRLRQQLTQTEDEFRRRLEDDREARLAAERSLDDVLARYQTALNEGNNEQLEQLRRQIEDQSLALRSMQERERLSETTMSNQIRSLESALERERSEGRIAGDVLAQRENELKAQREELSRLQAERAQNERRRQEAENARAALIAQAEQRRVEAESQADALRQQVAAERARAAETESELARAREELARRDAVSQERITTMQQELAKLAETRSTERGFIVTLPGLFFDSGKSVLKAGARNTLQKIADQLRVNDQLTIAIEGHTDSVGSDALNQGLSEKRAAAVRDYLASRGIPTNRMTTTGLGETSPVATNDTPAGRQQNRRVELVIAQ